MDLKILETAALGKNRLMGLDMGEKTIGIAISYAVLSMNKQYKTLRRTKFSRDAEELLALAEERQIGGIVIGLPLNMDGTEGPRCQSVRQFAADLGQQTDLPIAFWDERLSTVAVTRTLLEADTSRARRRQVVDKMAAGFILQGALDRLNMAG